MLTNLDGINAMLGSGLVPGHPLDNKRAVLAIRAAANEDERREIIRLVIAKRETHRAWRLGVVQRDRAKYPRRRAVKCERALARTWAARDMRDADAQAARRIVEWRAARERVVTGRGSY